MKNNSEFSKKYLTDFTSLRKNDWGFFTTLNSQSTTVLRSSPSIMVAQGGMVKVGAKNPLIHS